MQADHEDIVTIVRKRLKEEHIKITDLPRLTNNIVTTALIKSVLRGELPKDKPHVIDRLAVALKCDPSTLKIAAVRQIVSRITDVWGTPYIAEGSEQSTVVLGSGKEGFTVPLYDVDELPSVLNARGFPEKESTRRVMVPALYTSYVYAFTAKDGSLKPRLQQGDIAIVSHNPIIRVEDYAVVGTKERIFVGYIKIQGQNIIIELPKPFESFLFERKHIRFISRIEGIYCPQS